MQAFLQVLPAALHMKVLKPSFALTHAVQMQVCLMHAIYMSGSCLYNLFAALVHQQRK